MSGEDGELKILINGLEEVRLPAGVRWLACYQANKFIKRPLSLFGVLFVQLIQYDKNCCIFLERMRLYSSYDLVQKFKSFVRDFVGILHETCSEAVHRSKLYLGKSS